MLDFRRVMSRIRKRILPTAKKKRAFSNGLPASLSFDLVNRLCVNHFARPLESATHQHLSLWKSNGAYRLSLKLRGGKIVTLIYKLASYTHEEIPALKDLPVQPGLPEYVVLSQKDAGLEPFLPIVYLAEEILPGKLYHYVLEDLGSSYHIPRDNQERVRVSGMLPALHDALDGWAERNKPQGLLQFDRQFSHALYSYAWEKLEQYVEHHEHSTGRKVLDLQQEIDQLLATPGIDNGQPCHMIHGDSNYSNIHIHDQNPSTIKLVDWEWAGYGQPYADLVSLIKGISKAQEDAAFQNYRRAADEREELHPQYAHPQWRIFQMCCLERGLLDASFLSVQLLSGNGDLDSHYSRSVESSLQRILYAYQALTT